MAFRRGFSLLPRRVGARGVGRARYLAASGPHVWGDIQGGGAGQAHRPEPEPASGTIRRVRRRAMEQEEAPGTAEADFMEVSLELFARVEKGVEGMRGLNDPFEVRRSGDGMELELDLGPSKGKLTLQRDWAVDQLVYMSPVSGLNKYNFDKAERRWLSIAEDRHDLVGILTRDLIRLCTGCPQI